jgi:YD repeat-containing protein
VPENTEQPSRTIFPTFTRDYRYDLLNRKILEQDNLNAADSVATQFTYDNAGNLISKTDREGKTTTYAYDNFNRLKKVTDLLIQTTEYTYENLDSAFRSFLDSPLKRSMTILR